MTLCSFGRSVLMTGLVLGFRSVSLIADIPRAVGGFTRRFSHSCDPSSTAFDSLPDPWELDRPDRADSKATKESAASSDFDGVRIATAANELSALSQRLQGCR